MFLFGGGGRGLEVDDDIGAWEVGSKKWNDLRGIFGGLVFVL